ncbi:glycosyl hydrolases 43 family protein [Pseudarthrobacter siccitolerans]|uniref:Glycosyl hydrolases 43 family protein n=1 Tax=Pseudarthrobacter siccitolerans TaxID=861266 RepID=A0A024GXH8_9MICC|nr:family 43 glycosylhydrolase [Pseudarthrobacter siccitolerans]CCQ44448.1 glycosyl hydrolases 43 family protein [Pseudarthrobacter siccitolerans]
MGTLATALFAAAALSMQGAVIAPAGAAPDSATDANSSSTITNDTFWKDTAGNPIFSQGGGIFDFKDPETGEVLHYWYGPRYTGAIDYYNKPTQPITTGGDTFVAVSAYSSKDLVNWKYEGDVLSRAQVDSFTNIGTGKATWVGRMGVAYVKDLNKYALFSQHGIKIEGQTNSDGAEFVALSDSPTGPFVADRRLKMTDYSAEMTVSTGDQTVFTDDDGTSYLVYSKSGGRNKIFISRIGVKDGKVDLLDTVKVYDGAGREGNCLFKYNGRYYMSASDLFGWNASRAYYLVADNINGPYTPTNDMQKIPGAEADFGHVTQTGFYYTVKGTQQDTVIYAGDRWADFAGNGLGYNQWVPLSFSADGTPYFNSMSQWNLNATTGAWSVADGNDYVLNGGFEADRVKAPYTDKEGKPIPEIAGWRRTNPAAVWNDADKSGRVGNFNLTFWSASAYSAKIEQTIDPVNFPMPDGAYTLSAQVRKPAAIEDAKLFAISGGQTFETSLSTMPATGDGWVKVSLPVNVVGGSATIGMSVNGKAEQLLRADDFTLTAVNKTHLSEATSAGRTLTSSDYSSASWQPFSTALGTAENVLASATSTQAQIDAATSALTSAQAGLASAVTAIAATTTKDVYPVGEPLDTTTLTVTASRADGTSLPLTPSQYSVSGFSSAQAAELNVTISLNADLAATGVPTVSTSLPISVHPAWQAASTYKAGDKVAYNGSVWLASWWTKGQVPGDPTGPWQEIRQVNGTAAWTPSRIFVKGDVATYNGHNYTAKWWTRNQTPGDPNGPWQLSN